MEALQPHKTGEHIWVLGGPHAWLYLVDAPKPVLIDTGMTFMTGPLSAQIRALLGDRKLYAILHTHSHFDHLGCTAALAEEHQPEILGCHPRMAALMERPRAVATMASLNDSMCQIMDAPERFVAPQGLQGIEDDAVLDLGDGIQVKALYTSGHTRDSMSWLVTPDRLLVVGEAAGVPITSLDDIQVEFLTDPDDYMDGIRRMQACRPVILGLSHGMFIENEARTSRYLEKSIELTVAYVARFERYFDEAAGDEQVVFDRVFAEDYAGGNIGQPETAYRLNLQAQVRCIGARRLAGV